MARRDFGSKTCAISLIYFMFCPVGIYRKYYYMMKCHVWILISLDTTATNATNLICSVVVCQNSCFIGYHGYQWYQYIIQWSVMSEFSFHLIPSVFRVRDVTSSQISNINVNQMSNIKATNPRLLSIFFKSFNRFY